MASKKILFIMNSLECGGAENVLITILKNFDYDKFEVEILLLKPSGVNLAELPKNVRLIKFYSSNNSLYSRIETRIFEYFKTFFIEKIRTQVKIKGKYSSIISFLEGRPLRIHGYLLTRSSNNITWVHTDLINNFNLGSWFSKLEYERLYSLMTKVVFVSNSMKKQFELLFDIKTEKLTIYNPIDVNAIQSFNREINIPKFKFTICFVGRLVEIKAIDRIIRLAYRFKNDGYDLDFWIIGDGVLRQDLEQLCIEYNVQDSVKFLGVKNPPYEYLKVADIFILTSIAEGFSIALCEAMCCGIPIVATRSPGIVEILGDGQFGLISDHLDDDLFVNVRKMVDDVELRFAFRNKSLLRAMDFNVHDSLKNLYRLL
jgi:glycosyltransferase involved in cell wall biosynthesis